MRNLSDLDLQVERGRQTLPAGHCSDTGQHDPHLMRAANQVATHYCNGAPVSADCPGMCPEWCWNGRGCPPVQVSETPCRLSDLDPIEASAPDTGDLDLPEYGCHRTREHARHVQYVNLVPQFRCPGVGDFAVVVTPPADPFAGLD